METLAALGVSEGGARREAVGRGVSGANGGRNRRTVAEHRREAICYFVGFILESFRPRKYRMPSRPVVDMDCLAVALTFGFA